MNQRDKLEDRQENKTQRQKLLEVVIAQPPMEISRRSLYTVTKLTDCYVQ